MPEIKEIVFDSKEASNYVQFINKYRGHATDLSAFNWQFSHLKEKRVVTGLIENEVVLGSQCMMPIRLNLGKNIVLSGKCENSYLDKSLRGKGDFTKMFKFATDLCNEKQFEILWAFTPALKPYSRLGFEIYKNCMRETFLWFGIPQIGNYFSKRKGIEKLKGILSFIIAIFSSMLVGFKIRSSDKLKYKSQATQIDNDDLTKLQNQMLDLDPNLIQITLSQEYKDWRIKENPNVNAESLYVYKEDELVAHVIYSIKNHRSKIYSLIYTQKDMIEDVLCHLMSKWKDNNIRSLTFQGNYENIFNQNIFDFINSVNLRSESNKGWDFVYRHTPKDLSEKKINPKNLLINYLWTEGYG